MEKHAWYLTLSNEVAQAINGHYMPMLQTLLAETELQGTDLGIAQIAYSEDPRPMTAAVLQERNPYTAEQTMHEQLAGASENGVLTAVADNTYQLTEKGRKFAQSVAASAKKAAHDLTRTPVEESEKLVLLLRRLVAASLAAPELDKACLQRSRRFELGVDAPVVERLRRALNDLAAFRDDVHIAAWRAYDIAGHEWEAFSHIHGEYVFGDQVSTAAGLAEKLGFRGYDEAAYEQALQKIAKRGWLTAADDAYHVTAEGEQVRLAVEEETDRLFYAPWDLSPTELDEVKTLMELVCDALRPPEQKDVWQMMEDARGTLVNLYRPAMRAEMDEVGFQGADLYLTRRAAHYEKGITIDYVLNKFPYMAAPTVKENLAGAAKRGFVSGSNEDGYRATKDGREKLNQVLGAAEKKLSTLTTLPDTKLERLASLLRKLSDAMNNAEQPEDKPSIQDSRRITTGGEKHPLLQVALTMMDLASFRDDVHAAAWHDYDMAGHEWEAFSHVWGENVWGDKVSTASEVAEKLAFRGFDEAAYTAALQKCVERGWLTESDGVYTVTEKGQTLRQEAEAKTDNLFYAPWAAINVPEMFELADLLTALQSTLDQAA
jgi:DNA-binding PadR family transcriptional regulator